MADYEVHLVPAGFRVYNTTEKRYIEGVWSARFRALQACADCNEGKPIAKAALPDRL